ncbi:hypothetical protein [Colwellia sp. RSH04]|uniref:hypothetical protein n=1 Tax=Colwellia sp. RSH04 TaxID=2305464 RepID=UPI000E56DD82|nr:hypothetical protein [Colwellia sp. RSH04]RHW75977.1 hypothetical protein D1094_09920 [Colwellia sp. RSH04]
MPSVPPLTAGIEINRVTSSNAGSSTKPPFLQSTLGQYADDVVNISGLAQEKLQQENQLGAAQQINDIANDVIRVTSTIGRAKSSGNLSQSQATDLYNKIANLL